MSKVLGILIKLIKKKAYYMNLEKENNNWLEKGKWEYLKL